MKRYIAPSEPEGSAMPILSQEPLEGVQEQQVLPRRVTRATRKPFGATDQKLVYPKREGYHRHWFNDEPGRIHSAQEAGYEHVIGHDGKSVERVVGTRTGGGPQIAYLMEIPQEWYDEDMQRLQDQVTEKEKGIKRGALPSNSPGLKGNDSDRIYAGSYDKGEIKIEHGFSRPR